MNWHTFRTLRSIGSLKKFTRLLALQQNCKMASSDKSVVAAGFIIYRKIQGKTEYLLLQTSYGRNHWTPPKGHVDPGESEFETALRETEEEAGFKGDQMKIIENFQRTLHYNVNGKPKRVVYWLSELCNPEDPVKLSHEHKDFKWHDLKGACQLAQFSDMCGLLKEVDTFLKSNL